MTKENKKRLAAQLISSLSEEGTVQRVTKLLKAKPLEDITDDEVKELLQFAASELAPAERNEPKTCSLFVDGSSMGNPGPAGAGGAVNDENGVEVATISEYLGIATSNVAEYKALILGLKEAKKLGFTFIEVFTDSELVANQVTGKWRVKDVKLKPLVAEVKDIIDTFQSFEITSISRTKNRRADQLATRASDLRK
jgi:ribonuclease HI